MQQSNQQIDEEDQEQLNDEEVNPELQNDAEQIEGAEAELTEE
jgi:hypothetical protein